MRKVRRKRHALTLRRHHRAKQYRARFYRRTVAFGVIALTLGGGIFFASKHVEAPFANSSNLNLPFQNAGASEPETLLTATPEWPEHTAAAAIGVQGQGEIAHYGEEKPRPTASVAKVITSLVLIDKYDLKPGQDGPEIPITDADVEIYNEYIAKNGSVTPVTPGTTITLRQAVQAMILPSSNNVSDTAAIWAFGSMKEYHKHANKLLKAHGLKKTTVAGDASGYDPGTQSTTEDLIKLGEMALNSPTLMEIAGLKEADIPGVGLMPNYNRLVTEHNYTGLKPGDTDEAGGTLLFTTTHVIDGKEVKLIGVILGTDDAQTPYDAGFKLMESTKATLKENR